MKGNNVLTEQKFISVLLGNKDLVGDWISSSISAAYFIKDHKLILSGIDKSYNKGALLTRDAFHHFAKIVVDNPACLDNIVA